MSVTGYLALYTTLLGWKIYNSLWTLMVGTGLAFLPFVGIVVRCFLEPYESQEPKNAAIIAIRRLSIQIVSALLVVEFCCVPTILLNPKVLHFEPACSSSQTSATPGNTGTTFDNQFAVPTDVRVPLIWYLVMAISNGFNHAAISELKCAAIDYRTLHTQLDLVNIQDVKLKKETIDFYNACYLQAYAKYMRGEVNESQRADIENKFKRYGQDDIGWLGSHTFSEIPGFYDTYFANNPVEGFPFDSKRDQFDGQAQNHSSNGNPSCAMWWSSSEKGLRVKLEKSLPPPFLTSIFNLGDDPQILVDKSIKKLMFQTFQRSVPDNLRGYSSLNDSGGGFLALTGSEIGIAFHQLSFYPTLYLLKNAIPVVQALLLMAIYAFIGLMIPFSSYRLSFIITGTSVIFAVTLWSFLSHWIAAIDNSLLISMFKDVPSFFSSVNGMQQTFVDMIIGTMYMTFPLLFLMMMSWAGFQVGHSLMGAFDGAKGVADQAGRSAKGVAGNLIRFGTSIIRKSK